MRTYYWLIFISLFSLSGELFSQSSLYGFVKDENGRPIPSVAIGYENLTLGAVSDSIGRFTIERKEGYVLIFSHISFQLKRLKIDAFIPNEIEVSLQVKGEVLQEVEVMGRNDQRAGLVKIDPLSMQTIPNPSQDFLSRIKLLPGVISNSELSSSYSVRGGNYDENLVFIEDIPVYRPFLITNGQQEGLSIIIPEFANNVRFSSGGWSAKYGGKMSSLLQIDYRKASERELNVSGSLMGGHLQAGGTKGDMSFLFSARYKSPQYLLGTLETGGAYRPRFADIQQITDWNISDKLKLKLLLSYSRNRYFVRPENRTTDFGSFFTSQRLFVAFDGTEELSYDTYQAGLKFDWALTNSWHNQWVFSAVSSAENEYTNLEGGYRLCDIDNNPSSSTFDECRITRGVGTQFQYTRNELQAAIFDLRNDHVIDLNESVELSFGFQLQGSKVEDKIREYQFIDSAEYVTELNDVSQQNNVEQVQSAAYISVQHQSKKGSEGIGLRLNYQSLYPQLLLAPRFYINRRLKIGIHHFSWRLSGGTHYQPRFYRELRTWNGELGNQRSAQVSHTITTALSKNMIIWGRSFEWNNELYGKYLPSIIPYDVQNVRIRYLPDSPARAYAIGWESRFGGEFIPDTESWFSLSILSTKESLDNSEQGYIRRPSDQRLTFGAFFQDHLPNDPRFRISLHMQVGSGLPFGPPDNIENRGRYVGGIYRRVDTGFSYDTQKNDHTFRIMLEILNMFGAENPITYTWIEDVNNNEIAVPNSLTGRFFNLRVNYFLSKENN